LCCAWQTTPQQQPTQCAFSSRLLASLLQTRYQIHTTEVTAVDFADDGSTVVSGALDGRAVVWSHVTGFKLAVITLHSAAVRSVSFNTGMSGLCSTHLLHLLVCLSVIILCCHYSVQWCLLLCSS
jgi:WD40 repeat protein